MPDRAPTPVLVMAYGSAPSLEEADVRAYLTHILQFYRQTDPTDDEVAELMVRYRAVGGSPLYALTEDLVERTQQALDRVAPGAFRVRLAMKHSPPFIEDVTRAIAADGATRAVGVPLAPFRSRLSTEGYVALVRDTNAAVGSPVAWAFADDWHLHPAFLDLWQARIEAALEELEEGVVAVFTNHSLPAGIREWNDPYETQFRATAEALAERCGLTRWGIAYQSAGGGRVPWLEPSLSDVLAEWAGRGARRVLAVPIGFLMDHLEILYDLDVVARGRARELGLSLTRTRMPNADPAFAAVLADVILQASGEPQPAIPDPNRAAGSRTVDR